MQRALQQEGKRPRRTKRPADAVSSLSALAGSSQTSAAAASCVCRAIAPSAGPWSRVRWDRVGRTGLLIVLAVVAGLYLQDAVNFIQTRSEASQQANVQRLARANAALRKQQAALNNPAAIKDDARALGMVQAGERPYVVIGLPKRSRGPAREAPRLPGSV